MAAEFDITAALRESEEMLKNIGAKSAPVQKAEQQQSGEEPGLLDKSWGWQSSLEEKFGVEQKPTTVAAALNQIGYGNVNDTQKSIADSVEDPEEISQFPVWHEKTPRQKEIAYEHSKRPVTLSDVSSGAKQAVAGFGGLAEGLARGGAKVARDVLTQPELLASTPEEAMAIKKAHRDRLLNDWRSFAESWTDLGAEVAHLYHKGKAVGFSNVDRILSNLGMSEETRREHWMARDALEMENARKALANPSSLATASKETVKFLLSFNGPSIDELLYLHPEFKGDREKAKAFKEKQVETRADEAMSDYMQWMKDHPADPDIKAVAALTPLPGIGAANLWSLGEKTIKGTLELGNVTRRLASGLTAEQWAAAQVAKRAGDLEKSAQAASQMGPIGRGAERVANVIDDSGRAIMRGVGNIPGARLIKEGVERTGEFLEEAGVPAQLQQGAKSLGGKVIAGATVGSFLDEDTVKGAAMGAGLGAIALGAPRFVADLSRASARNAKGITGTFGALAQDPTRGWMSRLATVRPEAVDWIAGHMSDFTKNAVHATPMAVTLGLMDSDDPAGFVKSMMEGWAWATGPQIIQKALGKDPTQMQRERSKYDHQVYKLKASMSPEAAQRFDVFANIEAEVAAAEKYLEAATQNYQKAAEKQGESETKSDEVRAYEAMVNKAQIRLEAAKKNASTPEGKEEFARQFWYRLADIDAHISGSLEPGKNVKVELLTTNEMLDKLGESNSKTMSELGGPLPSKPMSQWGPEEVNMLSPEQRKYYQRLMFMSEAEGASYLKTNTVRKSDGQRIDRKTGEHVVWDPKMEKGTVALNSDVIIKNMIHDGNAFLSVYAHEIGHQLDNFDEHKKRTSGLREKLFGTERKDAQGNVIARTEGIFSDNHLVDLFMEKYGRSNANLTPEQVAENMGLYDAASGQYDIPGIVRVMRDEVLADFNAVGLYRNYFFNQPRGAAALVDWLTIKDQNSVVKRLARRIAGLREEGSAFGERSGAEFTPEAQRLIEQHMREMKSLRGNMAPHNPEESYTPPVAKKDLIANKELSDYYLTDSGRFKTEMAAVVYDKDGKIIAEVVLQDPEAKEGSWFHHLDENGRSQITQGHGDGEMPPELGDLQIPMGGHLMSVVRLSRDASGKPIENSNSETREMVERRSQAIRDAIDNSGDAGAPDRLRPVAPGSNTYRGTLTDAQIEAIRRLPNRVVPYSIKKKLYDVNNALKKGDGTRLLLDYATRIDARGRYVPFSPKIQDVVPIGMMFSSDGHFLVTTVSISRMMSKLDRWEAFMPIRLKPWNGSKGSFMEEFVGSYLENHQNGLPGSGFDPSTGEVVPGAKPLARDAAEAETKRNIFNDFLNMYDSNTVESNPDRTELPKLKLTREQREDERLVKLTKEQRKAEKSSDQNTMVRSLRLDSIMDLVESDLKKIPVDYYKAKHNMSLNVYEDSLAQRPVVEPESDMLRGMRLNMTQAPGGPRFSLRRSEGSEETMVEPGFYSQMGRTLFEKMPARTNLTQVKGLLLGQGVKADEVKYSGILPYLEATQAKNGEITRKDVELFLSDNYKARFIEHTEDVKTPQAYEVYDRRDDNVLFFDTKEAAEAQKRRQVEASVREKLQDTSLNVRQAEDGSWEINDGDWKVDSSWVDVYGLDWQDLKNVGVIDKYGETTNKFKSKEAAEKGLKELVYAAESREVLIQEREIDADLPEFFEYRTQHESMDPSTYQEVVLSHPDIRFTSEHYPSYDNYVAHMRLQDGKDALGKSGKLIEELQSDLHQTARKKGGYDVLPDTSGWHALDVGPSLGKSREYRNWRVMRSNGTEAAYVTARSSEEAVLEAAKENIESPPSAPLKQDWPLQLFKRALKMAVDENKSWVGFTTGEEQISRYKLSRVADSVRWFEDQGGQKVVYIKLKTGETVQLNVDKKDGIISNSQSTDGQSVLNEMLYKKPLSEAVGEELAAQIISEKENRVSTEGLEVGGKGMRKFYDDRLPRDVQKYISQWGGEVKKSRLFGDRPGQRQWRVLAEDGEQLAITSSRSEAERIANGHNWGTVVEDPRGGSSPQIWKIDITPKMAEGVMRGQALFSLKNTGEAGPRESIDPEQNERSRTTESRGFGATGSGQAAQEERLARPVRGGARLLQDAVRRADSEAKEVRGESEGRQSSREAKRAQDAALVEAASQQGMLLNPSDFLRRWRESGGTKGAEHLVAFEPGSGFVEKRTNAPLFHNNWSEYFDRIAIHNKLFPETAISIEGVHDQKVTPGREEAEFLNDANNEEVLSSSALDALAMFRGGQNYTDPRRAGAYVVTKQPYVDISETPLSQDQISEFLAENNFYKVPSYKYLEYYNPEARAFLQDAHDGNIVSGTDSTGVERIHLLDTPFRYATKDDAATISAFNKMMRGKLMNGKISQEKYAELKPFLEEFEEAPEGRGALEGVQFSLNTRKSITTEEEMRKLDSLADKKAKQTDADTLPYPVNPNADSVTLPPRYGLVNANIVGMPRSFKDVQTLLTNLTTRLTNVAYRDPQFALEAASFYSDMADSALKLADAVKPDVSGMEKWLSAELNMRFLALGSPKSAVAANATKSGSSVAGSASDFAAGFKIGMGEQAMGAKTTQEAWKRGEHFDLSLPGVQDKVRSFYLNGLAELIELAQKEGDDAAVKELMLRAGKSMRVFDAAETELNDARIQEVQRLLDGKATVDMWDMAAKGEAWPGYLMTMSERNKKTEPFQWSQDKFEKKSNLSTPQWQKVLKELKISGPEDLRYQQARALKVDGNAAWDEVSWEARKQQPFPDTTQFSYYTKATEAGLSPGGGGPLYDAQQAIDGMLADRLNELGLAKMFGKEKLKARNSQEILWALEKLDNPIKRNNDLSLFKASFDPFMDEIMALRGIPTAARSHLGRNVLGAMERTYGEMARQVMPLEVVSSGTSVEAQAIQKKIADLQASGDTNAAKTLTDWVADGLHDAINTFAEKHGLKVTADRVAVGEGGYTEAAQLNIAPNMRVVLRGDPAQTYQVLEALSRALDQDGGNIIRKPSVRELNDVQKVKNKVLTFDTTKLPQADRNSFFMEAAKLLDADGNPFLTGFTETETGLAVGNQFYSGDFEAAIALNQQQLQALTSKYSIPKMGLEEAIIDTFYRGQDASKTTVSPFAKAIYGHIANRLSATPQAASFPQAVNFETLWRGRADSLKAAIEQYPIRTKAQVKKAKANAPQIASATKQTQAHTELKSQLLAAVLRDEMSKDRYKELMVEYGYAKPGKEESDESDE